jgi:LysM repeat protein
MDKKYRRPVLLVTTYLITISILLGGGIMHLTPPPTVAHAMILSKPLSSPAEVIALVNQLRAANGLPPYQVDSALMAAAQGHSDYQASTGGNTGHTGPGGSSPKQRAIAAGYGGGAAVFVSENIAMGTNMTPALAVELWQGDSLHLNTMLSPNYTDAGAGVASDGNSTYITLDVGYISGQAGSNPPAPTITPGGPTLQPTRTPSGFFVRPVQTVTPMPDGSIVHTVQPGDVLFNIAAAYGVKLSEIYRLNNLNDKSVIFPGQKLKIKGPDPTATFTLTPTSTQIPTATRRPTRTPTHTPDAGSAVGSLSPVPPTTSAASERETSGTATDPVLLIIGALVLFGAALLMVGYFLKRND